MNVDVELSSLLVCPSTRSFLAPLVIMSALRALPSAASKGWGELIGFKSRMQCCGVCCSYGGRSIRSGPDRIRRASSAFFKSRADLGVHVEGLGAGSRFQPFVKRRNRDIVRCSTQSSFENDGRTEYQSNPVEEEDPVTKLLRETPSQVEPKYKIGNEFYTLKQKMLLQRPLWKKLALAISSRSSSPRPSDVEIRGRRDEGAFETGVEAAGPSTSVPAPAVGPVYLSDLLRQYKGSLFVPEEAFEERISELEDFNRSLDALPEMTFEDCWKYIKSDKVKLLTSRGIPFPSGGFVYWDFVVELKDVPGEKKLQHRKW